MVISFVHRGVHLEGSCSCTLDIQKCTPCGSFQLYTRYSEMSPRESIQLYTKLKEVYIHLDVHFICQRVLLVVHQVHKSVHLEGPICCTPGKQRCTPRGCTPKGCVFLQWYTRYTEVYTQRVFFEWYTRYTEVYIQRFISFAHQVNRSVHLKGHFICTLGTQRCTPRGSFHLYTRYTEVYTQRVFFQLYTRYTYRGVHLEDYFNCTLGTQKCTSRGFFQWYIRYTEVYN